MVYTNQQINFSDTSLNKDTNPTYDWDFGDGTVITGTTLATVSHTYTAAGTFNVAHTVRNECGTLNSCQQSITVTEPPVGQGVLDIKTLPILGDIYVDGVLQGTSQVQLTLDPGSYTVSFGSVTGFITPQPQTVSVVIGQVTYVTGTYVPEQPQPQPVTQLAAVSSNTGIFIASALTLGLLVGVIVSGRKK